MLDTEQQTQPPSNRRRRRLHWSAVAGLWLIAGAWIGVDPLTGTHSSVTSRWMSNMSLLLVAAACTMLIGYLIQVLTIEPYNDAGRQFELGYYSGWHDRSNEGRPALGIVTELDPQQRGGSRTGT